MSTITTGVVVPAQITTRVQIDGSPLISVAVAQELPAVVTLISLGQRGDAGPPGPQGNPGPPGAGGDLSLKYDVSVASNVWTIVHNLGKYPSVTTIDSSGTEYSGAISYPDVNTVVVEFAAGFSGSALLN